MKEQIEKQAIEEMAKDVTEAIKHNSAVDVIRHGLICVNGDGIARELFDDGYRKQSVGCKFCGTTLYVKTVQHTMPLLAPLTRADELRHELLNLTGEIYLPLEAKFCPLCGARMKGGAE